MEILVIGTEPPCIRCLTTYKRSKEVAENYQGKVEVRKIPINSEEAAKFGKIGSGGSLAKMTGINTDFDKVTKASAEISALSMNEAGNADLIETKFKEIDKVLEPVKAESKQKGYLMTPVLVVNGQVKCADHVPDKASIQAWIEMELKK